MGLTAPFWTLLLPMHQARGPHRPGMAGQASQPVSLLFCLSAHARHSIESLVFCLYFAGVIHTPRASYSQRLDCSQQPSDAALECAAPAFCFLLSRLTLQPYDQTSDAMHCFCFYWAKVAARKDHCNSGCTDCNSVSESSLLLGNTVYTRKPV